MPITDPPDVVFEGACDVLGPLEFVADRSWPHGVSTVIEVRDLNGSSMIVKSPADVVKFDAELHAYVHWAPALDGHVPELVAADRSRRLLVPSKLRGEIGDLSDTTFREAGRLLRRLHGAEPFMPVVGFADSCRSRFESWTRRARPGLLSSPEVDFVAEQVRRLVGLPDPDGVPCHRDWQPRNWLTAPDATVSVIDFGNSRVGHWFEDFERMWWTEWRTNRELGRAFFDGYGRELGEVDREQLRATSIMWLFTTIVWADEVGDASFGDHARTGLTDAMAGAPDPI
jgi:Ser/Thr protein kinase RdoA (MazF antagonist)